MPFPEKTNSNWMIYYYSNKINQVWYFIQFKGIVRSKLPSWAKFICIQQPIITFHGKKYTDFVLQNQILPGFGKTP